MKFTLLGCGVLGGAILEALFTNKIFKPEDTTIVEMYPNANTEKFQKAGATLYTKISELKETLEFVLLAVKPQQSKDAMTDLKKFIDEKTLVISIMAGVKIATIEGILGKAQIIRVMPNTPCQILAGMSGYYGTPSVTEDSFKVADKILTCMGKALRLKSEEELDPVTAVSGSGPAYVFYLAESMQAAAKEFGFNDEQSKLLVIQTLLGSAQLLAQSNDTAAELRKKVTSPGGTTEAAINSFEKDGIRQLIANGMQAAKNRSIELAKM